MRKPGKRGALIAVLASAASLAAVGTAQAADTIVAPIGADPGGYSSGDYNMDQGESVTFQNSDLGVRHDVRSRGLIGGGSLFLSPTFEGLGSRAVAGTKYLTQGDYQFFCNVHPLSMTATLHVSGAGTPVARPDIEVKIITGKIARIARRGRVLVKVTAVTKSDNVALVLKLGKRRIGAKANIDLETSRVRRVPIVLSNANRNRFVNRARAKLKLVGTVQFGAPDGAQKIVK